ncbi:hypothetical protein CTAM01_12466 [Colletotrichum tamarilloi]|uniref:Uncharacterized protein n=1 Tax=Colletotrichum tamarilloi TaxID=1209934 RepID=A0ABQ9QUK6_9PEZI|nr:uncharacterized protein CTAM01_12466 [Colletotrichum tamarilloi]KAK1485516.1 hypothetical protein CTAM01_12466 [Colletotrichum tamarilloi]
MGPHKKPCGVAILKRFLGFVGQPPRESSGTRAPNGQSSSSSSTVPVDRSLGRSQTTTTTMEAHDSPMGMWLTQPFHQEPYHNIAAVSADGSAAGQADGRQGPGASATYASSRPQQQQQQQPR